MVKPTSKAALKQQCLYHSNLDIDKAERMYNFLVKDMEDIPAVEPSSRNFLQNFGDQANGVMGWLRENKDMLEEGVDFIRNIITKRKGTTPITPLPPINE
jgi:hypothetical protein